MNAVPSQYLEFKGVLILAYWDADVGVVVQDFYPSTINSDILYQKIKKIFSLFHSLQDPSKVILSRTKLTIPLTEEEELARVIFDGFQKPDTPDDSQEITLVATLLVPSTVLEEQLLQYDLVLGSVIQSIQTAKNINSTSLRAFLPAFLQVQENIETTEEYQTTIDEKYTLTEALQDFKQGIKYFQEKKWKAAYPLLRKALFRFQMEHQSALIIEILYLLPTVLVQLQKFAAALPYFEELEVTAKKVDHVQYYQSALFMQGYCHYKLKQFQNALQAFEKIDIQTMTQINKLQYYTFKGRTYGFLNQVTPALENLNNALTQFLSSSKSTSQDRQHAQLLYDLGMEYHKSVVNQLQISGYSNFKVLLQSSFHFQNAVDKFSAAIAVWEKLGDFNSAINTYQIMINLYGYLRNVPQQLHYIELALHKAEEMNNTLLRIRFLRQQVHLLSQLKEYAKIRDILHTALEEFLDHAYIDHLTYAEFHQKMGDANFALNDYENALLEYLAALNIYQRLPTPVNEHVFTIESIIRIYQIENNLEKTTYYQSKLELLQQKLQSEVRIKINPLGIVNAFWIISTDGLEYFSYSPQMAVDPNLFAGFISALQSISQELSRTQMESFVIGEDRYVFYHESERQLYILGKAHIYQSEQVVLRILKYLYQSFYQQFAKAIDRFFGDVTPFKKFEKTLDSLDTALFE